eukprot:5572116-Lingulodinium_polyedra.AAC.1
MLARFNAPTPRRPFASTPPRPATTNARASASAQHPNGVDATNAPKQRRRDVNADAETTAKQHPRNADA